MCSDWVRVRGHIVGYLHVDVALYMRVAAELGDFDEELDCHHLEMKQYVPNQEYLDHKIIKFHKKHR